MPSTKARRAPVRVAHTLNPNAGYSQQLQRYFVKLLTQERKAFVLEALEYYRKQLAQQKAKKRMAKDALLPDRVQLVFEDAKARYLIKHTDIEARKISYAFVRALLLHLSRVQKRTLLKAGISRRSIREAFKVPLVRGRYISASVGKQLPTYIESTVNLISNIRQKSRDNIKKELLDALKKGKTLTELKEALVKQGGLEVERAARVAADQNAKITQFVHRETCKDVGITHGIWIHVPGQFSSRKTHMAMNGKMFDLSVGLYDPEVGMNVKCGELPYCQCTFKPIIPKKEL